MVINKDDIFVVSSSWFGGSNDISNKYYYEDGSYAVIEIIASYNVNTSSYSEYVSTGAHSIVKYLSSIETTGSFLKNYSLQMYRNGFDMEDTHLELNEDVESGSMSQVSILLNNNT
jgi:hypothetical protein